MNDLRAAVVSIVFLTLLVGGLYPLAVTGVLHLVVPQRAGGSLVTRDGVNLGSSLLGQLFASESYFHGRPSAAGTGYDATASGGSNLGPTSAPLLERIRADVAARGEVGAVAADAVTASASGLDPHVSPENAQAQVARVASARGLAAAELARLVDDCTEKRTLGFLGEPRVNVLALNLALDDFARARGSGQGGE
jgi:K+-transporting ATPase ATPase C chain